MENNLQELIILHNNVCGKRPFLFLQHFKMGHIEPTLCCRANNSSYCWCSIYCFAKPRSLVRFLCWACFLLSFLYDYTGAMGYLLTPVIHIAALDLAYEKGHICTCRNYTEGCKHVSEGTQYCGETAVGGHRLESTNWKLQMLGISLHYRKINLEKINMWLNNVEKYFMHYRIDMIIQMSLYKVTYYAYALWRRASWV